MKPVETLEEARAAGSTHLEVICSRCQRAAAHLLDVLELRTHYRTLDQFRRAFKCSRCGHPPTEAYFLKPSDSLTFFEFAVKVWDEHILEAEQVAVAAQSADEAIPAFHSVAKRYPRRLVTLQSRTGLVLESGRDQWGLDV